MSLMKDHAIEMLDNLVDGKEVVKVEGYNEDGSMYLEVEMVDKRELKKKSTVVTFNCHNCNSAYYGTVAELEEKLGTRVIHDHILSCGNCSKGLTPTIKEVLENES